jgi:mannan endo-1,4-beta-mannosidase
MVKNFVRVSIVVIMVWAFCPGHLLYAQNGFVKRDGATLMLNGKLYNYMGTNYWFGGLLALKGKDGKKRLKKELDFLKKNGVTNLRVMVGAEGEPDYKFRVSNADALQPQKGVFRDSILYGLDYLLVEMDKRNMKAVLHFTNTWDWSGGLGMYLEWNGYTPQLFSRVKDFDWNKYRDYITQFYNCEPCQSDVEKYIKYVLNRTNSISGIKYVDEPVIMAWQIINEPRPMRAANKEAFLNWISKTAALVKSIDPNHLLSTGSEGDVASDKDMEVYKTMHADKNIDYLTIHMWPKNWNWFKDTALNANMDNIIKKAEAHTEIHVAVAKELNKPLVMEEFGMPRDLGSLSINSSTVNRDLFYNKVFSLQMKYPILVGNNFWAFGGLARPIVGQEHWKEGDDYTGDPGGEGQGLNAVFTSDKSTWKIIKRFAKKVKQQGDK